MGLSARIFTGLGAGILVGLFFGELVADLKIFGDIFIKLLQVTILPYIIVSLIAGFGRMDMAQAKTLAWRGSLVLVVIWVLALVIIFLGALAFPNLDAAAFFSSARAPEPVETDLLELYLPANVFYSLSQNLVPAVVVFSILMGVALISVEDKSSVLPIFDSLAAALSKINAGIVQLTPYGIFAIAAAAAGTMTIEELSRVQVYLVTYVSVAVLVTFWIFPGLVAALSGISFREVLAIFKDTLVMAFATGNQFVVLPQIAENCKTLLKRHQLQGKEVESAIDIIVPVSFNFPSLGKLLVLLFVLFAAWFTDTELNTTDRLALAFNGLFSLFGSINVAVPYLLDSLRIPADMFQLFLVTGIVVGRFGAMLAALHIIVLSVLGTLALSGRLTLRGSALLRYLAITTASMFVLIIVLRAYFLAFVPETPPRDEVLSHIELMNPRVPAEVLRGPATVSESGNFEGSRLDRIMARGQLRVGYRPNNLPCSFLTPAGELVGFDVEMAHLLAEDLGVSLQFVPFEFDRLGGMLDSGQLDTAMSCIASLPDRYTYASFSRAYLDLTLALVVADHDRALFGDVERMRAMGDLKIALVGSHYFAPRLKRVLPEAQIVEIAAAEAFFSDDEPVADALLLSAEEGAAYSYRHPRYTVVPVADGTVQIPAGYPVPRGDAELRDFISNWVDLKRKDGTIDSLYAYWMLGGAGEVKTPRWSIVRDVLGWVD